MPADNNDDLINNGPLPFADNGTDTSISPETDSQPGMLPPVEPAPIEAPAVQPVTDPGIPEARPELEQPGDAGLPPLPDTNNGMPPPPQDAKYEPPKEEKVEMYEKAVSSSGDVPKKGPKAKQMIVAAIALLLLAGSGVLGLGLSGWLSGTGIKLDLRQRAYIPQEPTSGVNKCDGWATPGSTHCNTTGVGGDKCVQYRCTTNGVWERVGPGGVCDNQSVCQGGSQTSAKCDGWADSGSTHCNTTGQGGTMCHQYYCNNGKWEDKGAGGVCNNQAACTTSGKCTPGQVSACGGECGAGRQKICRSTGEWSICMDSTACGYVGLGGGGRCTYGMQCKSGVCDPTSQTCTPDTICVKGTLRCKGTKDMEVCSDDGTRWNYYTPCIDGKVCMMQESGPACVNNTGRICVPGVTRCNGNIVENCSGDGTRWVASSTCATGKKCVVSQSGASCVDSCTPKALRCNGTTRIDICTSDGTRWDSHLTCSSGSVCVTQGTTVKCLKTTQLCQSTNYGECPTGKMCKAGVSSSGSVTFSCVDNAMAVKRCSLDERTSGACAGYKDTFSPCSYQGKAGMCMEYGTNTNGLSCTCVTGDPANYTGDPNSVNVPDKPSGSGAQTTNTCGANGSGAAFCTTWTCPNGDTNNDGQCTYGDSGASYISGSGNSCGNPTNCGQVDYYTATYAPNWTKTEWDNYYCGHGYLKLTDCGGTPNTGTPTTTTTLPPSTPAVCSNVAFQTKDASGAWVDTALSQLSSKVKVGDTVRLVVAGGGGNFTKARFRINNGNWMETTSLVQGINAKKFYLDYTITAAGQQRVEAQVYGL